MISESSGTDPRDGPSARLPCALVYYGARRHADPGGLFGVGSTVRVNAGLERHAVDRFRGNER